MLKRVLTLVTTAILVGCGGGGGGGAAPPAKPTPAPPKTYKVAGRVTPSGGPSPAGVVAFLFGQNLSSAIRQTRHELDASPSASNVWPFARFQQTVSTLQKSNVSSATLVATNGTFEFPEPVVAGSYLITVGIPILHDPGMGRSLPRDWPAQLVTTKEVAIGDRKLQLVARGAWFLEVTVREQTGSVTLEPPDFLVWPTDEPSGAQINDLRTRFGQLEPVRQRAVRAELDFQALDTKARKSGQPLHVKETKKKKADVEKERGELKRLNDAIAELLAKMFPSAKISDALP